MWRECVQEGEGAQPGGERVESAGHRDARLTSPDYSGNPRQHRRLLPTSSLGPGPVQILSQERCSERDSLQSGRSVSQFRLPR